MDAGSSRAGEAKAEGSRYRWVAVPMAQGGGVNIRMVTDIHGRGRRRPPARIARRGSGPEIFGLSDC